MAVTLLLKRRFVKPAMGLFPTRSISEMAQTKTHAFRLSPVPTWPVNRPSCARPLFWSFWLRLVGMCLPATWSLALWTASFPALAHRMTLRVASRPSWSRCWKLQAFSIRPATARWSFWTRSAAAHPPMTGSLSRGHVWSIFTTLFAAEASSRPTITS